VDPWGISKMAREKSERKRHSGKIGGKVVGFVLSGEKRVLPRYIVSMHIVCVFCTMN